MENKDLTHVETDQKPQANCNVKQSFNYTVGAVALIVAAIAGYFIYKYFTK